MLSGRRDDRLPVISRWLGAVRSYPVRAARLVGVRGRFEPTHFVWSRGLALMCEHNGGGRFVREQRGAFPELQFDAQDYGDIQPGDLVWVRVSSLPQFVEEALPQIRAPCALLSGDNDWSMPSDFDRAGEITASEHVVCWFTQNYDGSDRSGKMLPLPIGLDFHTISQGRRWGHQMATPEEQERELEALRATMLPNERRLVRVHADFHFNRHARIIHGETRQAIETELRGNPSVDFQRRKLPRLKLWRKKTRYAFVVSPHGNGLDCHRTWESLALGNIVIVKRSPLDPLYEGLPVVIVDRWGEIDARNLSRWHEQYSDAFGQPEVQHRLSARYWIDHVRREFKRRLERA